MWVTLERRWTSLCLATCACPDSRAPGSSLWPASSTWPGGRAMCSCLCCTAGSCGCPGHEWIEPTSNKEVDRKDSIV